MKRTAFVLTGGGSLGAAQVGMLRALTGRGVCPDLVVGASIGALNAVHFAARPDPEGVEALAALWLTVGAHDVLPRRPGEMLRAAIRQLPAHPLQAVQAALGLANYAFPISPTTLGLAIGGRRNYLFPANHLEAFLERSLPVQRLQDTAIPVEVLATENDTGCLVTLTSGSAPAALLASSAIPGLFPIVRLAGMELIDGAYADATALDRAVDAGAERVYVLTTGFTCTAVGHPHTALGMALHGFNLIAAQRMATSIARAPESVELFVVPPVCPVEILPIDFSSTADLLARATESTAQWLQSDPPPLTAAERHLGEPHLSSHIRARLVNPHDPAPADSRA
jgi:NTE family protein